MRRAEIREESNIRAEAGPLLDASVYEVVEGKRVLVVIFGCSVEDFSSVKKSGEHSKVAFFEVDGLAGINLPEVYRGAIRAWQGRVRA